MRDMERRMLNEGHIYIVSPICNEGHIYIVSPMFNEGHGETNVEWGICIYIHIESAQYSMRDIMRRPSLNVPYWILGRLYMYIYICPSLNQPDLNVHKGHWETDWMLREKDGDIIPPKKLLGCGFSTPNTIFCSMCTIASELNYSTIFTNLSEPGSISAGFQWTGLIPWIPSRFSCGRAECNMIEGILSYHIVRYIHWICALYVHDVHRNMIECLLSW